MASQKSLIKQAWLEYARAYQTYNKTCKDMEITVKSPRILFVPGRGWEINGKLSRVTAEEIVTNLKAHTADCVGQMQAECAELTLDPADAMPIVAFAQEAWYSNIRPALEPIQEEEQVQR